MGTFNFSNMQGGQQQETQNIPREFRPAVEQAKTEPVGSYGNNKTGFWDEVKNFFSGADVDTSAGFIDETGTWNNGTKQELAKYYPTQKSAEELEKDRLGSLWDRAYKKYHYSKDDVLLEAKKISAATNIPENAILANADNLANARNVYNYQQKAMDPQEVFKAYPELSELAKLSDTDAAIALHNLKNVRQTQGIIEAAKTGWELDNLMSERGRMGYAAMNGKELTDADIARLGEIEKAQKNSKELPGLFEDPMSAIVGGTVQSGKMMLRNALNGQKMGVYGAGFGALLGGIAGGGATLGAGTAAGAAAGAKIGYSVGSRIGMAQDMYDEIAGNNYLDYRGYKDKQGRQLLTDNQARSYAAVAAALETGIEFANADKILNVIKGGAGAQSIKEIISSAKDSTELQSLLAAYLRDSAKNIGTVAISESAEEGVQEMSNRIISDIAAANNPGGDIPTYTAKDVIVGGLEASWQALPASIGFGAGAHGASTVSFMRRASAALQLKSEEQKANLRDANGISMLRSLAEDIKNNALFKKAPEVYNEVLNNQLKGTELETINIDTEYVLNQQGGYELLKSAAKAAGIGEQYLKDIIDTKADLKISTADYVSKLLPTEIGAHLEDYITFSDISECLARNREYAGRMRREMDRILAYENRQREDALNTYLDNNFHTPETREIAEAVLRRFPDNPKEGVKEIRKSLQAKIDEPLNQIIEELEKGMGNGVAVVEIPEYDNQMRGRGIKVSNNDPWYQRYYKENKHKPSKMELRELAREIWTGHNEYGLFGWENRTPEDNQWYENNKASMEATEEAIRRLDALTPALEEIDPGELSITEGLSEEGFEVYRKLRGKLEGAESKEVRQAAQMSAILAARMADRMAELHRQVGHAKYTALDYARSIGLIRSKSEAAEQKFNQAVNVGINENTKYKLLDLDILQDNIGTDKETPEANQKAIDYIKHVLTENEPVTTKDLSSVFDFSKMSEYDQRHIVLAKSQRGRKNKMERQGRNLTISNPREILQNAVLVEINPSKHSNEVDNKLREDIKGSLSYRFVIPVKLNGQAQTLVITAIGTSANVLKKLNEVTLYEVYTTKIPPSQRQASLKDGGIGDVPKETIPSEYSLAEILAKVKDLNHKPYVDKETGKLIIEDQMAIGSMKLDQKAWHGTPYDFERFDIGKIGDGVGDQVHGWGLYFAKDRKISEAYKEVLGADAGAVIVDGVTYKIDEEGDWATAAGQKLIDNDPLEFVLDTFDAMTGNKNKERAIKSLKERIAGTKRTANTESYIAKLEEAINIIEKADVKYENTSRLLKVEVPENNVLLDEQKTFINQNKNVQALLKNTIESLNDARSMKFWENLLNLKLRAFDNAGKVQFKIDGFNKLADGIGKLLESKSNTFGYRTLARSLERYGYSKEEIEKLKSDGEYRNQEQQKLRSQAAALEEELERAKAEDAAAKEEVINQAKADISGTLGGMFSGNKIYDALAKAMGEEDYNWRGASELLNEHGIKGIAYEGMKDGRCFVVFDDKAVDIIERYNQSAQRGLWQLKGQTAFKTTGEKVISLFKVADQSTFMHEMAHIYLHDMLALAELPNAPKQLLDDVVTINQWAAWNDTQFVKEYKGTAMESEFKKLNEQMKTAVAQGSVDIEGKKVTLEQMQRLWMQERFARGFENYLKSGDAPTEATRSIFRRFKQWLTKIYRAFSQIGGAPSKEVKAVMDRMIASEDEIDIAMRKKGVDDFAESGGMDYLEGSTKDVYRRMVERAKADAEEKVLKIALKDVKEDYRQQEKELFEREEAEYREKLAAEPVFIIQEHIKNNPDMSTSVICETLGMNVEDYVKQLREYGGSLDAAVKAHMKEFKEGIDNSGIDAQYFRERAEEVVQESKYRKLATAMELEAFERIAKKQRNLTTRIEAEGKNDAAEKGVIKTVDKMTRQSKQIEELTAETKGLKQDKRELLANVRGLRDAALSHYKDYVQYVEMKLEVMPIEDANNYQMWRRKSAQAQYNSEQSLIKGNWDKAVKYKQAQLIYDMFADRAVRNAKQIKKIEDGLKRKQQTISKAKNISADERYAYNHLMYVFGFSDADAPVPPHYEGIMEVLMKADATREEGGLMLESPFFSPDGQTNLPEWFLQAAMNSNKRKAGHKDLSNMQVDLVAQVMHIIYKRGMDNMKLATIKTKDGRTLTVDEAVAEIEGQTRQRMIERANADPTGANKNRWQDDAANFIDQSDGVLIKPEVELKKLGDVALRYIYDPLKEAADKELKMAVNMQNKLKGLFDTYSPKELADMRNKRLYDFGSSKITKEQAIMIALNWGTETNQQRVLDGYHVNVAQVKNVLQYLDERDWNLVNSIWKLYDIHWDQIREIEARMTGAVLQKQEAKGFVVVGQDRKIYTLDGGYFPIKYDLRDLRTQEQADAAQQQSAMSNIAMSLGKGFLKERTQHKVERRLDLRFEVISGSITDVIHLVAFREPVRDVRRIVLNENFKNLVYNYLGQNAYKNLKKWTSDCWAEEPIPRTAYEKGMAKLRNAQTMGTMGFRVITALLNIANASSVAHYMGAAELLHSLKKFYSAPRRYTDFVFQRSVFMAERAETMDASIHDALKGPNILDGIPGIDKAGETIKNNAFKMITWTDLMLALPLWQHEYEKTYNAEVDAGRSPQQAREAGVNAGDAAVRWCFGSGRTVDKAAIQRKGSELMKQLTMYYSYNSTVYNALNYKLWEAKVGYKKAVAASAKNKSMALMKAVAHAGDALLMWVLLPAVISALLRAGASGDDDDWKIEKLIKSIGQESLTGIVGGIPVLRDAVPYFMAKVFDEHQFAPKIPIQNTIEQTNRVIQSAVSDKKTISDTLREMGKLTSQVTGAPSTLIDSFTTTLQYLESGFDESVADYLRALIFDKKLKKNQK